MNFLYIIKNIVYFIDKINIFLVSTSKNYLIINAINIFVVDNNTVSKFEIIKINHINLFDY